MNHAMLNNRISQLPIAMAGIVHTFSTNGGSLSKFEYTEINICEKMPALTSFGR